MSLSRTAFTCIALALFAVCSTVLAGKLGTTRDTISTSAPGAAADHTIEFVTTNPVPPSGKITLSFNEGGFTIPVGLDHVDVDFATAVSTSGPFTERPLASSADGVNDGVSVTTGASGVITITLNSTNGIGAGTIVRVKVGTHATTGGSGDSRITHATATGAYRIRMATKDASNVTIDSNTAMIFVIDQVGVGPADTTDTTPPVVFNGLPTGILQVGTRGVVLSVETDEDALCRYATSSLPYASMTYSFATESGTRDRLHTGPFTGLEDDTDYTVYVKCEDWRFNVSADYLLEFTIGVLPGASSTATTTGSGTGSGSASSTATTTSATSTGTGTGTGASGSGSGSSESGGEGSGSGSGSGFGSSGSGSGSSSSGGDGSGSGSGGGGQQGGNFLNKSAVKLDGYGAPSAQVTLLKDGVVVKTAGAGSAGEYSFLVEDLERGVYTFSLYMTDAKGVKGATYSSTMTLRSNTLSQLGNVMLPPTASTPSLTLDPGAPVVVSGYTAPNAMVKASLRPKRAVVSSGDIIATTTSAGNGAYEVTLPTTGLSVGTYEVYTEGMLAGGLIESDKSVPLLVGLGQAPEGNSANRSDLNNDGKVNLIDFSILLFNWNTSNSTADINQDGNVNLADFSIMLFNWTG